MEGTGGELSAQVIVNGLACGDERCRCQTAVGKGQGFTHCPTHLDRGPSLNVEEKFGTVVVHCEAQNGCDQMVVIRALRERGLWPGRPKPRSDVADLARIGDAEIEAGPKPVRPPEVPTLRDRAWETWVKKTGLSREFWRELGVGYLERRGLFVFPFQGLECAKYRPWPPRKEYQKYIWDERKSSLRPPLWPIPTYDERADLYLTAGETDCAVARFAGYRAHALSKGEAQTLDAFTIEALRRINVRRILVVLDLDDSGLDGAHGNAEKAHTAGMPVRVVTVPPEIKLLGGKDLNDLWHFTNHDVARFRQHLDAAVNASVDWAPEVIPASVLRERERKQQGRIGGRYQYRDDPQETKQEWIGNVRHRTGSSQAPRKTA